MTSEMCSAMTYQSTFAGSSRASNSAEIEMTYCSYLQT
jgi:hypothetical protein